MGSTNSPGRKVVTDSSKTKQPIKKTPVKPNGSTNSPGRG